jgi:hypothetical protein
MPLTYEERRARVLERMAKRYSDRRAALRKLAAKPAPEFGAIRTAAWKRIATRCIRMSMWKRIEPRHVKAMEALMGSLATMDEEACFCVAYGFKGRSATWDEVEKLSKGELKP